MKRARSPNYPAIDLETAISRAKSMSEYTGKHEVDVEDLFKDAWGYTGATGTSKKTLAALKYFGLVDQQHGSNKAKLTDTAQRIIHGVNASPEHRSAIQAAFLSPKIYRYCWDKWCNDPVAPAAMKSHLILEKGFNDSTVGGFIKDYRNSLAFAGMIDRDEDEEESEADNADELIGQLVQWESQGVLQFDPPRRVTGISEDREYAYIEGSRSGVLISELKVVKQSPESRHPPENPQFKESSAQKESASTPAHNEEIFSLGKGQIMLRVPEEITPSEFEDLTDWFVLIHRKIGRSVSSDGTPRLVRQD